MRPYIRSQATEWHTSKMPLGLDDISYVVPCIMLPFVPLLQTVVSGVRDTPVCLGTWARSSSRTEFESPRRVGKRTFRIGEESVRHWRKELVSK